MSFDRSSNLLLASIPEKNYERLLPELLFHNFELGQVLYHPYDQLERIYFPYLGALISIIAHTEDGDSVEIGIAAHDGCAGLGALLGSDIAVHEIVIQISGTGVSIARDRLKAEFIDDAKVRDVFLRYTHSYLTFVSQSAVCNRLHNIEERLARWLLTCQDRVGGELAITQEFLGKVLGVSRATVNLAAGKLQRSGTIQYNRGKVVVTDRAALELVACECYGIAKRFEFTGTKKTK